MDEQKEPQKLPAIFRKWKDTGDIDIWFPTQFEGVGHSGQSQMTVYDPNGGHTSGSWTVALELTVPAKPNEYADLKERYERAHDMVLVPYQRYTKELRAAFRENKKSYHEHGLLLQRLSDFEDFDITHGSGINYDWHSDYGWQESNKQDGEVWQVRFSNRWDVMNDMGSYVGDCAFDIILTRQGNGFIIDAEPTGFVDDVTEDDILWGPDEGDEEGVFDGWQFTYGDFVELLNEEILERFKHSWEESEHVKQYPLKYAEVTPIDNI
jgi:hypothetical protein